MKCKRRFLLYIMLGGLDMENKVYGYCRCSTNESKQDGTYQINALVEKGVDVLNIRYEYISGRKDNRKILNSLFDEMAEGDTLIVTDITRLCRSTRGLCDIIDLIIAKRFRLIVGSIDIDCRNGSLDPMIEGMLKVNGVFGEMEAKLKKNQIHLGLANAVKNGKKLGRPTTSYDDIPKIFMQYYPKYKNGSLNKMAFARVTKLSYPTIYKYLSIVESS